MIDNNKYDIIRFGRIVEFDAVKVEATVQISSERYVSSSEGSDVTKPRKPLKGVPVQTCSGGGWAVTHPIAVGDTCIMFFSQEGYDHWYYEDKDAAGLLSGLPKPHSQRQFNEDDGMALVGLNTQPRAIKDYSATDSEWRNVDRKQVITLAEDLSIKLETTTEITIIAPKVTVIASTELKVTSPKTKISGDVEIGGKCDITGDVSAANAAITGEVSADTAAITTDASVGLLTSVSTHQHTSTKPGDPTLPSA